MYNILLIVQILVAIGIIGLVLMQHGKGADAGAAFGGGGSAGGSASGSVFGARGAGNFLSRTTAILALAFFVNSMALAWLVSHRGDAATSSSIVDTVAPVEKTIPVEETAPSDVPDAPDTVTPVAQSAGEESDVPEAVTTESSAESTSDVPEAEEVTPASDEKAASGDVPEAPPASKVDATVDAEAAPEKK